MNYDVAFTDQASRQLEAIRDYIAVFADPAIAERYVDAVIDRCLELYMFPHRGAQRDDLRPGLRTINFRKRVTIAFTVDDGAQKVTILGVCYGGQDLDAAFGSDDAFDR